MGISRKEQKEKGIFYTPPFLADYVARKALQFSSDSTTNVLDPACGDGELLAAIMRNATTTYNYVGIDFEREAINKANLRFPKSFLGIKADSIFPYRTRNYESGWIRLRKTCNASGGFSLIISNPPWGSDLSSYDRTAINQQFYTGQGQFDSFDIFVEIILNQLSNDGIYALIVPDTIFSLEHTRTRQLILERTTLKIVARLGEGIFPNINIATAIFIGINKPCSDGDMVCTFKTTRDTKRNICNANLSLDEVERSYGQMIPQQRFLLNDYYNFDIDVTNNDEKLIGRLKSCSKLSNWVNINRGAEISKKGTINKCSKCNNWFAVPRKEQYKCPHCGATGKKEDLLQEVTVINHPVPQAITLLTGSEFYRYTSQASKWLKIGYKGIKYKPNHFYKGPKILIRKTGLGITSCLDYSDAITVQCVYILKRKSTAVSIPIELISMILNSRLITYYLLKSHGDTEWKSHPYLTQTMIKDIPIPNEDIIRANMSKIKELSEDVTTLCKMPSHKNINLQIDLKIEKLVATLYGINRHDYTLIMSTINKAEQLIPIKRINNCSPEEIFKNGI